MEAGRQPLCQGERVWRCHAACTVSFLSCGTEVTPVLATAEGQSQENVTMCRVFRAVGGTRQAIHTC